MAYLRLDASITRRIERFLSDEHPPAYNAEQDCESHIRVDCGPLSRGPSMRSWALGQRRLANTHTSVAGRPLTSMAGPRNFEEILDFGVTMPYTRSLP